MAFQNFSDADALGKFIGNVNIQADSELIWP